MKHPECTCSWIPCHHSNYGVQAELDSENKKLKEEIQSLRLDAHRYRWLRDSGAQLNVYRTGTMFDNAIDGLMRKELLS